MEDILKRELDGEVISPNDPEYQKIISTIYETMNLESQFNQCQTFDNSKREILEKMLGKKLDESSEILPPFYVDYGKNIFIGKRVWIQQGCTFFDRGGIYIDDDVFIGPKVNLITLNHLENPLKRNCTYAKPIKISKGVRIGVNSTILPGITIGENSIIGAGSVVTKNVESNVIVAGNPAKVIRKIKQEN